MADPRELEKAGWTSASLAVDDTGTMYKRSIIGEGLRLDFKLSNRAWPSRLRLERKHAYIQ